MARRKAPHIADEVLDQLLAGTDAAAALQEGGLLDGLKKALAERALNAEMDHHLGGEAGIGNSRNGYGRKTVTTDSGGRIALEVPRDRQGSFDPQLIAKYQRRFPGFDEKIISMYARGMSTREIAGHLLDLYGLEVSPDLVSAVTDAVLDEIATWQARPLEPVYPLVFFDALRVKIRDRGVGAEHRRCTSRSASAPDGTKEILGLWPRAERGREVLAPRAERATQPRRRGHLLAVVDGLKGFPRTPSPPRFRKPRSGLYRPPSPPQPGFRLLEGPAARGGGAEGDLPGRRPGRSGGGPGGLRGRAWGRKYAAIGPAWRRAWTEVVPFYAFPAEVRRILYTTNAIEALNAKLRSAVRSRGHFPTDEAALKPLYLVLNRTEREWRMPPREWAMAKAQFAVLFGQRFTKALA
jgi:putative transposase